MNKTLKFNFEDLDYQTEAVNAVVDIFDGAEVKNSMFTIEKQELSSKDKPALDITGEGISYDRGHGNRLSLSTLEILENVRKIQEYNGIEMTNNLLNNNFTIEMETGTGKTYVYTKTILELNKRYGYTKFIIVVPSVAIREGVYKSLQMTEEHFKLRYNNVNFDYFIYNAGQLDEIHDFATSTNIQIMIINIDAFRKTLSERDRGNIIHRPSEKLSGNRPIDMIAGTNPVVIIDEPQSVDNTPKSKEAMKTLNPLVTLRYSATHKQEYNLMYSLTPVDAYQKNLVKKIEVSSVLTDQVSAQPFIKLLSTRKVKDTYQARVSVNYKHRNGTIRVKDVTLYGRDDIWEISNYVEYYENKNYILDMISAEKGNEYIKFANGVIIEVGETHGDISDEAIKRAQIRETIDLHLNKELSYIDKGIKVLSLFFIDKVANYRFYDEEGNPSKGKYAIWFEEEYNTLINSRKYKTLKEKYGHNINFNSDEIHDGYFSVDGKGKARDTRGNTIADGNTYELIMKDKERLLSFDEPLRFIFSHSALKEGWDNPNVFQVCTLVETKDELTKRQKVGRGLRLPVDNKGFRVYDTRYSVLSVIANESYREFADGLQKEFRDSGLKFNIIEKVVFSGTKYIEDGEEKIITQEESIGIYNDLVNRGYLTNKGQVTEQYQLDVKEGNFEVDDAYTSYLTEIQAVITNKTSEVPISDANEDFKITRNKEVFLSPEFKSMWDKIKHKTIYSINMDIDRFIDDCVVKISEMPKVKEHSIIAERGKINIDDSGVKKSKTTQSRSVGNVYDSDNIVYPDFVRRLQDSTGLIRKTIIEILRQSNRLSEFYKNPEEWLNEVSRRINLVKRESISKGIEYTKLETEYYKAEEIFDDTDLIANIEKNAIETPNKHIFDHLVYDSQIERRFAEDAENDPDVKLYAKLPSRFTIDTPYGKYNPDWVLVIDDGIKEKLYFVAETKGARIGENRVSEDGKIRCAYKHFEVLDPTVVYDVFTELKELKK